MYCNEQSKEALSSCHVPIPSLQLWQRPADPFPVSHRDPCCRLQHMEKGVWPQCKAPRKSIQILAPCPSRQYVWKEVTDPNTGKVLCNPDGSTKKETQLIIGTTLVQIQAHFNADVRIFANRIYCVLSSFLLICENIMKVDTIKASSALRRKKWKKES